MENDSLYSCQQRTASPKLRVTNPSLPSPDPEHKISDTERTTRTQDRPEQLAKHYGDLKHRQQRFRPPGYTSAAPWLRENGDLLLSSSDPPTTPAVPTTYGFLSNPSSRPLDQYQQRHLEAESISYVPPQLRNGPGVRLANIRPLDLPRKNRRSSAPPSVGNHTICMDHAGSVSMDRRRTSEISRFELLERPAYPRESILPKVSDDARNTEDGSHNETKQVQSHSNSVDAQSTRRNPPLRQPSLYQQRQEGHPLPEVAISASSLIIDGQDVYQDTRDVPHPRPARSTYEPPSSARTQSERRSTTSSRSARARPPIHLAVQGLSDIEEDGESTFRPADLSDHPSYIYSGVEFLGIARPQVPPFGNGSQSEGYTSTGKYHPGRIITRQPQPQPHPTVFMKRKVDVRNAKGMPYAVDGTRDWSTDLCLFCDHNLGTCCKALWCPCVIYGRNKRRIEHLNAEQTVHTTRGGTCSHDCAVHACLTTFCLLGWALQIPNRASVRRRYSIDGDWLGDCAAALFCSSCELSQESREIDLEERILDSQQTSLNRFIS